MLKKKPIQKLKKKVLSKKKIKTEKNTIYQEIIQNEKQAFLGVANEVADEINTLLDSTMSYKEMTKLEITSIAEKLIEFQTKKNVSKTKEV